MHHGEDENRLGLDDVEHRVGEMADERAPDGVMNHRILSGRSRIDSITCSIS
jgi:hypothetical protein